MPQTLTLVKILDRVLYRTDGVTQVSVADTTIVGVDSGRFDGDELLSPPTIILAIHRRKIFSGVRRPLQIIRGQGLPECISPQQTVEDTPKYFPHVVRFDLKLTVALLLSEEKCKVNF